MRFTNPKSLVVFTALPLLAACFSITKTADDDTVASAIFTGPGLTITNVNALSESSMGTFTDGPFGLGCGGILTSGKATGTYLMGDRNVDNGIGSGGQYDYVCASGSQNINALQVQLELASGYNGVRIEFVFATQEAPSFLANMDAISILDPPLVRTIPAPPAGPMVLVISVCDVGDALNDSGFLVGAEAFVECDYGSGEVEIKYAFTTSTLPPGEQPYTSTITASGTSPGTFIVFVEPTGATTTTSEPATTADETTTIGETTVTTTAEPTTTTTDDLTTTTGQVTKTTEESTTAAETTITTIDELTTTEMTVLVIHETTTTTAVISTKSSSTTEETTITEPSTIVVTSELETLTADEAPVSLADTTTSIQIEFSTSVDIETVLSTTSEVTSTSVNQGPIISDTSTSEAIVSTSEELIGPTNKETALGFDLLMDFASGGR
ncbi:hypothetical protein FGADI_389 [Fusarium gaditjirri]|uniref:Uncharacterized protein n=1 Tax=Fusarium gaditjirri TaxID=282569 RepID=A0A8H4TNB8_9HYPO|nr:hypothetical protein FGADI_389 [Fusarium gaditjirri]